MNSGIDWIIYRQYASDKNRLENVYFMDRMIENFSCSSNDEYHIEGEMGMALPPFVARFSSSLLNGNMLGVADEDGHVKLVDSSKTKDSSILKEWSAHSNAIFDLAWIDGESKMVTASGDQTARLWDVDRCEKIGNFRGHTCSLKSIAVQSKSSCIFLTGARDGNIMLWDTRCSMKNGFHTPVSVIHSAHELPLNKSPMPSYKKSRKSVRGKRFMSIDSKQSVTAAVFQDDYKVISSGACDGALKYWDIRKSYSSLNQKSSAFHVINLSGKGPRKHGFTSLVLNSTHSLLYSVCTNNIIYEFSTTNLSSKPVGTYQGHRSSSFYVKAVLSPDDKYLLCGSCDNSAYVWRTDQTVSIPWTLNGHLAEVTSVAWSPNDGDKIVTCSDDNTFKVWRLFQNTTETAKLSGNYVSKSGTLLYKNEKVTEATNPQEYVLISDLFEEKRKRNSKLSMCSNGRAKVRWICGDICNEKDTIFDALPVCKNSPFTKLTPKISSKSTPDLKDKSTNVLLNNASGKMIDNKKTKSPKSSCLFMETWLNSPRTPPQLTPQNKINPNLGLNSQLVRSKTGDSDKSSPHAPLNSKEVGIQTNTPTLDIKEDTNLLAALNKNNVCSRQIEEDTKKANEKELPTKSKRLINTHQYGNIKSMLLSMKRKCKSPNQSESTFTVKRHKDSKENMCKDIVIPHHAPKVEQTNNEVLKEICNQKDIRDVLDIAEDSYL